jgi:hypothetical protein
MSTSEATVEISARRMRKLVEFERGQCGGDLDVAQYRVSAKWGFEPGTVKMLWKRWRELKSVKAHVFERLRHADEWLEARAAREREITKDVADALERRGSPAARLARQIAELASEE